MWPHHQLLFTGKFCFVTHAENASSPTRLHGEDLLGRAGSTTAARNPAETAPKDPCFPIAAPEEHLCPLSAASLSQGAPNAALLLPRWLLGKGFLGASVHPTAKSKKGKSIYQM